MYPNNTSSRPSSRAHGTLLRPITRELVKQKSRRPKFVHKPPFRQDVRCTNDLLKTVYPNNFTGAGRGGDRLLDERLGRSTSDSELLRSVGYEGEEWKGGLAASSSASFVGVFSGNAAAVNDGLPATAFENESVTQPNSQSVAATPFAYQTHINSLMAAYQQSLAEQAALTSKDFDEVAIPTKTFIPTIPDPTVDNGPLAKAARMKREIKDKIDVAHSLSARKKIAAQKLQFNAETLSRSIETLYTNDLSVDVSIAESSAARFFAPPLPPSENASLEALPAEAFAAKEDFSGLESGDVKLYLFLPSQMQSMRAEGVELGSAKSLAAALPCVAPAGTTFVHLLHLLRSVMKLPAPVSELRIQFWNGAGRAGWTNVNSEIEWRDAFNIATLKQRRMLLVVKPMLSLDEIRRVASPVPKQMPRDDATTKGPFSPTAHEMAPGDSHIVAEFPKDPTTMPNHLVERDEVSEKYYKNKKAEWEAAEHKTQSKNRRRGSRLDAGSLMSSNDSLTMTAASNFGMGVTSQYQAMVSSGGVLGGSVGNASVTGGLTRSSSCLLNTVMGANVKNRHPDRSKVAAVQNRMMNSMQKQLTQTKPKRETRFREVFGNAVNVYSNLLEKFQFDELFKDDNDPI
jgi:hypothetical protein